MLLGEDRGHDTVTVWNVGYWRSVCKATLQR